MERCRWAEHDELMRFYHDNEWGVPIYNDRLLFEFLTLEGAQAGLSWLTILKKREHYRTAFDNFEPEKIAAYSEEKIKILLKNPDIIRNKMKIQSVVSNARLVIKIQKESGSFSDYIWSFTKNKIITNRRQSQSEIPNHTKEAQAMSRDLKTRGFKFTGPTICYSFMQAAGMVNDHTISCFRYKEISKFNNIDSME